jgi:predicted transposase YdaD
MPTRMAQYLTLILDSLRAERDRPADPACVVIYLDKETYREDPGVLELEGLLGLQILVRYKVIRLWEQDPSGVLALEGLGLLPFLPLLRGNPEELLVKSRERILNAPEAVAPAETKRELFTILATIAARVIRDRRLVAGFLSEAESMEIEGKPNVFLEMLAERASERGFKKGREEGREEGTRQAIQRVLERRFGPAAAGAGQRLERLTDLAQLEKAVEEAAVCPDLATFLARLPAGPELTSSP